MPNPQLSLPSFHTPPKSQFSIPIPLSSIPFAQLALDLFDAKLLSFSPISSSPPSPPILSFLASQTSAASIALSLSSPKPSSLFSHPSLFWLVDFLASLPPKPKCPPPPF